jgi:hypothetical protein
MNWFLLITALPILFEFATCECTWHQHPRIRSKITETDIFLHLELLRLFGLSVIWTIYKRLGLHNKGFKYLLDITAILPVSAFMQLAFEFRH